jgi:protein transport protein SEC31
VSSAKDGRTILWDLFDMKAIDELPADEPEEKNGPGGGGMFGGAGRSQQKRYAVKWAPGMKGVLSTCSFDRKVQVHSMVGGGKGGSRAPNWLEKKGGVACGFGGKLVSFDKKTGAIVTLKEFVESPDLVAASEAFESGLATSDNETMCANKAMSFDPSSHLSKVWGFMRITFQANAREQLVKYLGFDSEEIERAAQSFSSSSDDPSAAMAGLSLSSSTPSTMSKAAEETVSRALLVGNFEAAVECCFQTGQLADALILSSCGGAELWQKTQEKYFQKEAEGRPYLKIVNAVINNRLDELVAASDLGKWQETLAILSTYGKSEEFPVLCEQLGSRLNEAGDVASASLCYVCALNLEKSLQFWKAELEQANAANGGLDIMALHQFVEKATVFSKSDANAVFGTDINDLFAQYAEALANQGLFSVASKYARSDSQSCAILRDRLFHASDDTGKHAMVHANNGQPIAFPFEAVNVNQAPVGAAQTFGQQQPGQGAPQQQQQAAQQVNPQQPAAPQLPPGWIAMQDPASGRTYYANQQDGTVSWDMPAPVAVAPAPAPVPVQQPVVQQPAFGQQQQPAYGQPQQQQHAYGQQPVAAQPAYGQQQQQQQQPAYGQPQQQQQAPASYQPQPTPVQAPAAAPMTAQPGFQQQAQQPTTPVRAGVVPGANLANKYGDGFVSSASNPELAAQYGNIGTANPYNGAARPGQANIPGTPGGTLVPEPPAAPAQIDPANQPIVDGLNHFLATLGAMQLLSSEKKQLVEVQKGVALLIQKLGVGGVDADTCGMMLQLVQVMGARDYNSANAINTNLANTVWKDHKDWLKGIKFLIQLVSKKM